MKDWFEMSEESSWPLPGITLPRFAGYYNSGFKGKESDAGATYNDASGKSHAQSGFVYSVSLGRCNGHEFAGSYKANYRGCDSEYAKPLQEGDRILYFFDREDRVRAIWRVNEYNQSRRYNRLASKAHSFLVAKITYHWDEEKIIGADYEWEEKSLICDDAGRWNSIGLSAKRFEYVYNSAGLIVERLDYLGASRFPSSSTKYHFNKFGCVDAVEKSNSSRTITVDYDLDNFNRWVEAEINFGYTDNNQWRKIGHPIFEGVSNPYAENIVVARRDIRYTNDVRPQSTYVENPTSSRVGSTKQDVPTPTWVMDTVRLSQFFGKRSALFAIGVLCTGSEEDSQAYSRILEATMGGGFTYVERSQMNMLLQEQELGMSGLLDEESISEAGLIVGAESVHILELGCAQMQNTVSLRSVDAERGEIEWSIAGLNVKPEEFIKRLISILY